MIKENVHKAYNFAKECHKGQVRKFTALPYFSHPKWVARVISDITKDEVMVASALLHDVVEDCANVDSQDIHLMFGDRIGDIVDELTSNKPRKMSKRKYLTQKMSVMSNEALLIKLVDRLHNIIFLESDGVDVDFITKYVNETQYIFDNIVRDWDITHGIKRLAYQAHIYKISDRIIAELDWLRFRFSIPEEE